MKTSAFLSCSLLLLAQASCLAAQENNAQNAAQLATRRGSAVSNSSASATEFSSSAVETVLTLGGTTYATTITAEASAYATTISIGSSEYVTTISPGDSALAIAFDGVLGQAEPAGQAELLDLATTLTLGGSTFATTISPAAPEVATTLSIGGAAYTTTFSREATAYATTLNLGGSAFATTIGPEPTVYATTIKVGQSRYVTTISFESPVATATASADTSAVDSIAMELASESGVVTDANWLTASESPPPKPTFVVSAFEPIAFTVSNKPVVATLTDYFVPLPSSARPVSDTQVLNDQSSLLEVLKRNPNTTAFAALLEQKPAVLKLLDNSTKYHVFAPSNDAFAKLVKRDGGDDDSVVTSGAAAQFAELDLSGKPLDVQPQALKTIFEAPPWANLGPGEPFRVVSQPKDFTALGKLKKRDSGGDITIISGLGKQSTISGNKIQFNGGTVQIADSFFTKPEELGGTLDLLGLGNFKAALKKAGMLESLSDKPKITLFVPQNSGMPSDVSVSVINHHIATDTLAYTPDLVLSDGKTITSAASDALKITSNDDEIHINDARIVRGNIILRNGVLHVVDKAIGTAASAPAGSGTGTGTSSASGSASSGANKHSSAAALSPSRGLIGMTIAAALGLAVCWTH